MVNIRKYLALGTFALAISSFSVSGCNYNNLAPSYAATPASSNSSLQRNQTKEKISTSFPQLDQIVNQQDVNKIAGEMIERNSSSLLQALSYDRIVQFLSGAKISELQQIVPDAFAKFRGDAYMSAFQGYDSAEGASKDEAYLINFCVKNDNERLFKGCKYLKNVKTGEVYEITGLRRLK